MPCGVVRSPMPTITAPLPMHEDVAALAVGRVVRLVVVAVVEVQRRSASRNIGWKFQTSRELIVSRLRAGLRHRVDRQAVVDPGGVVPLEQVVGQRR